MAQGAEKRPIDIFSDSDSLQRLLRAQRVFDALDAEIQPVLTGPARGKIRVACVEGSTLVLSAASSAWASRARLEANRVLEKARAVWPQNLSDVRVIVGSVPGSY